VCQLSSLHMLQILLDVLRIELGLRHAEFVGIHSTPSEAFLAIAGDDRSTLDHQRYVRPSPVTIIEMPELRL
jgi:hypothetical protein